MATCPACGVAGQPDAARFCHACGAGLGPAACSSCRAEIVAGARFCSTCGAPQEAAGAAAPPPLTSVVTPVASRRITSVLFGDLVGFTSLSETRDQEAVRELLSSYFEACSQIVARYGGTVEKFIGDAVMAVWGVPTTHEDDAERSVRAGLELVQRIAALGSDVGVPGLAMRVGIVTGEVAVTVGAEQQGMVAGDPVNTASRVQGAAPPGQVWVDETTRLLTSSAISYADAGSHRLKGKAEPMPLWSVRAVVAAVGGAQRADGLEAPLTGRGRELRLAKEVFHRVEESWRPGLLVVDGEPGVGKSRLGWEFEKYSDGLMHHVRWHRGRCLAYGEGVAFFALAEVVRARLQLPTDPDDDTDLGPADDPSLLVAEGLERWVPDAGEREWLAPRLGALLGVGGVTGFPREDLFSAWATFLHRVSEDEAPVVLLIDDAQHADEGLLLFLEYLLAVGTFPCFVLLLTRPGLLEAHPALATNRRATVLHLETLSDADMGVMLDGLVVGLPDTVRTSLVERAEGVPLFAVETVRSLIDRDLVVPRGGQYVLDSPEALDLHAVGAPASLQALISARLDTLPPAERRVVDQASVLGNAFAREDIASLVPDVTDIDEALSALVRVQVLRREHGRFSSERGQYQFVQSAVRQVAYGTLSRRDRKASHLAVVALLEAGSDADSGELASVVAQHYLEALDAVPADPDGPELAAAAVVQLRRAAARAAALGAPGEAAGHLSTALARCGDPGLEARIEGELAEQLLRSSQYRAAIEHAERSRDALDRLGETDLAAGAVAVLAWGLECVGEGERSFAVADERLRQASRPIAPEMQLELLGAMLRAQMRLGGDFRDLAEESARIAERVGSPKLVAESYVCLGLHYITHGPRALGRMLLVAAAEIARDEHDPMVLTRALTNLNAAWTQDDALRAAEIGREAIETARTTGEPAKVSLAGTNLMLALTSLGDWDQAVDCSEQPNLEPDDATYAEMVRGRILAARARPRPPAPDLIGRADDPGSVACARVAAARGALDAGTPPDLDSVLAAVETLLASYGAFDDFTVIWQHAAEVAGDAGDTATLWALLAAVDAVPHGLPLGLQAESERVRGLLLASDEAADPAEVEQHLRASLAAAERWNARPAVGRSAEALGLWLGEAGRAEEAVDLLALAREVYAELGADRWAAELDARTATVSA